MSLVYKSVRIKLGIFAFFLFSACVSTTNKNSIDLNLSHENTINADALYSDLEIIPLSEFDGQLSNKPHCLAISKDYFFILNGKGELLCFKNNGSFISSISLDNQITAFSLYKEKYLDVLSERDIIEYSLPDFSVNFIYHIPDTSMTCIDIMRRDDSVIVLSGFIGNLDAFGEYYFEDNSFYSMSNSLYSPETNRRTVAENSHFFRSSDNTYYLFSDTGEIWEYSAFLHPVYKWDFGHAVFSQDSFFSAQLSHAKVYMSFMYKEEEYLLIYDGNKGEHSIIRTLEGGTKFPLGTIYKGYNYYVCPSVEANRFVDNLSLSRYKEGIIEESIHESNYVVLKYKLAL